MNEFAIRVGRMLLAAFLIYVALPFHYPYLKILCGCFGIAYLAASCAGKVDL